MRPMLPASGVSVANPPPLGYATGTVELVGVQIVFAPPPWPILLPAAAAAALAWELAVLLRRIWRGRRTAGALGLTLAALLAGPVVAAGAALHGILASAAGRSAAGARRVAAACAGGTFLAVLACLTVWWRPGGAPGGAMVALTAVGVVWAVRSYRRTTSPLRRPAKAMLLGLRIAVLVLLGVWGLGPALEYHRQEIVRGALLIGLDRSASMRRRDVPRGRVSRRRAEREPISRIDAVRRAMAAHADVLASLARQADVELFVFDATAAPAVPWGSARAETLLAALTADGQATAIGDAAAAAFDAAAYRDDGERRRIVGILLITDGCNNTAETVSPEKLAALMGSRSVRVYTVGVGSDKVTALTRTLSVKELAAPDEVEAFNRLPISVRIEAVGLAGRTVQVTCRFGQEVVGSERFVVSGRQARRLVRFTHVPLASGFRRLTVTVACEGKQVVGLAGLSAAGKLVHVVDREMRVLYVEGRFRYESKYIARALSAARRFGVDRRVLLRPTGARETTPLSEKLEDWLAYHAIIFGDVAASHFTDKQLAIVRELVGKYGKGFCMIGGQLSFGRGGWGGTPIADVLPIDLELSKLQIDRPVRVRPTAEGLGFEMLRIGTGGDIAAAWAKLPTLPGANLLGGVKPGALVLAVGDRNEPLIVAQQYGSGRALAVAFDTTWRWVLTPEDTAEMQQRFWRQVVFYLAAPKGNIWIVTDKTTYDSRRLERGTESVGITAGVEDARGRPMPEAPVTVTLTEPGGRSRPVRLRVEGYMRRGRLVGLNAPGDYVLKISTRLGDKTLAALHRFEIVRRDLEALQALANFSLLGRMASASGGRFATLADFGDLLRQLRVATRPQKRDVATCEDLGEKLRWPIVAVLILLLCAEWALRKRRGLV